MKLLDRYIAKNFLIGYAIAFAVLIGLRVIIDLFLNVDEFVEHSDLGFFAVIWNVVRFYLLQSTLYFRDFAGIITVVAAVFSVGKMVRSGEFVALVASGVSLKRVIVPIVVLALILNAIFIIDQELIIPPLAPQLVRSHDAVPGEETYSVDFVTDANGVLICAQRFEEKTATLYNPTIFIRKQVPGTFRWTVIGLISASEARYNEETERWDLVDGNYAEKTTGRAPKPIEYFSTDLTPRDIPIRHRARFKTMLSSRQLSQLAAAGTKVRDLAQLHSQKHFRITDPIINMVMLLISLPILICRDPRTMKSAIIVSFGVTMSCFITTSVCKMMATEVFFENIYPALWAWIPIFIFATIGFVELDSMKT